MNLLAALYFTNPKRVFEKVKMKMEGEKQGRKARMMMAENPRTVYKLPDLK